MKILRTASLGSNFTGFDKKEWTIVNFSQPNEEVCNFLIQLNNWITES